MRVLPFLGRIPEDVSRDQVKLLGAVALALLFEHYDVSTLSNASKYIRASFELPQAEVGRMLSGLLSALTGSSPASNHYELTTDN